MMNHVYPKALYIIRLKVENVSIVTSHLTWGFPAPSAFVGFGHALQRKLSGNEQYQDISCSGVGILCHQFTPQVTKTSDYRYAPYQLNLARHPLEPNGNTPPIVEEGRGHMEVSLIIGLSGEGLEAQLSAHDDDLSEQTLDFIAHLNQTVWAMRLAGGAVFPHERVKPKLVNWNNVDAEKNSKALRRYLLPSFALTHRHDVLCAHQKWLSQHQGFIQTQGHQQPSLLESLLDISRINLSSTAKKEALETDEIQADWAIRPRPDYLKGWLVPIPIGYGALTPLQAAGTVTGARDSNYPVRFVETLLSLGEWKSPHRINNLTEILWAYQAKPELGLYELTQPFAPHQSIDLNESAATQFTTEFDDTETEEEEF